MVASREMALLDRRISFARICSQERITFVAPGRNCRHVSRQLLQCVSLAHLAGAHIPRLGCLFDAALHLLDLHGDFCNVLNQKWLGRGQLEGPQKHIMKTAVMQIGTLPRIWRSSWRSSVLRTRCHLLTVSFGSSFCIPNFFNISQPQFSLSVPSLAKP